MSDQDPGLHHEPWPGSLDHEPSMPICHFHLCALVSLETKRECGAADQVLIGRKINTREIDDGYCEPDSSQNWRC